MLAFHLLCARTDREARDVARAPLDRYLRSLVDAADDWTAGMSSADYPGYDQIIAGLRAETFESQVEKHAAWVGSPERIAEQIAAYDEMVGGFEGVAPGQLQRRRGRTRNDRCGSSPKR